MDFSRISPLLAGLEFATFFGFQPFINLTLFIMSLAIVKRHGYLVAVHVQKIAIVGRRLYKGTQPSVLLSIVWLVMLIIVLVV
jgi:hypothetical protein